MYIKGESSLFLSKKFGVSQSTVIKTLNKKNIQTRGSIKYNINSNYLDKIDCSEKAYFLGFSFGDGNIYKPKNKNTYRFTIEIKKSDKEVLERFNQIFSYTKPLYVRSRNSKWEDTVSFIIYNQNICKKLLSFGIVPNKTLSDEVSYDFKFLNHFIRGLFDSDGHVSKDSFTLLSSLSTSSIIEKFLTNNKIPFTKRKRNNNVPLFDYKVYSRENLIKLRSLLYKDSKIFLKRKFDIFDNISMVRKNSFLSKNDVIDIKKRLFDNETCKDIANDYKISRECVSSIKTGRTWSWLKISSTD